LVVSQTGFTRPEKSPAAPHSRTDFANSIIILR
jgi:hypothetical protein